MSIDTIPFAELSGIVDKILTDCDEDVACIRMRLSGLVPETRDAILASDLLNAWQVFFYYYQAYPGDDAVELLIFNPASSLREGVPMGEYGQCHLRFSVTDTEPEIIVS
ncbi:MAG: hypothetical protein LUQ07_05445, partial [Methanospirillum sp.]|nr:hypothetical protein [Methanospirillum sp.]